MRTLNALLIGGAAFTGSIILSAQADETRLTETPETAAEERESPPDRARHWDLSAEEWARYESIMDGPRGKWSPDLDPIWVLGIHAETERERRYYAERAMEQERQRVADELAFQRAYDEAWDRHYPDRLMVTPRDRSGAADPESTGAMTPAENPPTQPLDSLSDDVERIVFVADTDCDCTEDVQAVIDGQAALDAPWRLDIFLTDTDEDAEVQRWAIENAIPTELVRAGRITLNHDDGTLAGHDTPSLWAPEGSRWSQLSWSD